MVVMVVMMSMVEEDVWEPHGTPALDTVPVGAVVPLVLQSDKKI